MKWEAERDANLAANAAFLAEMRALRVNPVRVEKPVPEGLTMFQQELVETNPDDYPLVEQWLSKLPRKRQREHFRKVYLREYNSLKDDGSVAFACGNSQRKHANQYLREILNKRLNLVLKQYDFSISWLELNRERVDEFYREKAEQDEQPDPQSEAFQTWKRDTRAHYAANQCYDTFIPLPESEEETETPRKSILEIADSLKPRRTEKLAKLPFFLIPAKKLDEHSRTLALLLSQKQFVFIEEAAESDHTAEESNELFLTLYKKQGEFCREVGFPIRHWDRFCEGKLLKPEQVDTALSEIACEKFWLRTMKKAQKRQIEHIAIACGEVQKRVSPYISKNGFGEFQASVKKSFDFLRAMIIENVADPSEQAELFEIYLKSSANPEKRRLEMITHLRGIEEWSAENEMQCLFLTLTAPSAFHAQLHNGAQNPKWNGSSPRATHQYLNLIWGQFRSLLAKRSITFHGMRVAEPHHDATPHWHILFFVKKCHAATTTKLFRQKALELHGDEKGAKTHRAKVEYCDPTKGTPTGYIIKYISKNIIGLAKAKKDGDGFNYMDDSNCSDEMNGLDLKDNSLHATAWARLWGIRQFQFFGIKGISVWRELRRLTEGDVKDKQMEELRLCANYGESAAYLDRQGGAGAKRSEQLAILFYEDTGTNRYGQTMKRVVGVQNQFTGEVVITRKKKFTIKKRPADFNASTESAECNEAQNGGLARPWTCVSNCNRENDENLSGSGADSSFDLNLGVSERLSELVRKKFSWLLKKNIRLTTDQLHELDKTNRVRLKNGRILSAEYEEIRFVGEKHGKH
ncbi:replication endonuclease [Testudinibacter sp. P27/CKL/0425]